jgi:hypothetical protein
VGDGLRCIGWILFTLYFCFNCHIFVCVGLAAGPHCLCPQEREDVHVQRLRQELPVRFCLADFFRQVANPPMVDEMRAAARRVFATPSPSRKYR